MADECELGFRWVFVSPLLSPLQVFRDTNESITADPSKDLYKAMYEWIDLNQDVPAGDRTCVVI